MKIINDAGSEYSDKINYWQEKLKNITPLELPTDYPRPAVRSNKSATAIFRIDKGLTDNINKLSNAQGVSLFITLLASIKVLLHRYSGQQDICVGTLVTKHQQPELNNSTDFFVNTLALRSEIREDSTFTTLLQELNKTTLDAYEQVVPFEKVINAVTAETGSNQDQLFQVMFVLQHAPEAYGNMPAGVTAPEASFCESSKTDIIVDLTETAGGIEGAIAYCTDLYEAETIDRIIRNYKELLHSVTVNPEMKTGQLKILSQSEETTLLTDFNDTAAEYPKDKSIIDLFEEQVLRTPEAIAVEFEENQLSYQELNARSNQLAYYLQQKGVTDETLVPICIERSLEMVIGILGVMKAGGAYVPIDPEYPADRISYMLEDTRAQLLLSSTESRDKLPDISAQIIELDKEWPLISKYDLLNLPVKPRPGQLAYIIYTSGSTGKPKGVMIEHGGLVNLAISQAVDLQLKPSTKVLQFASFSFDASCYEIFITFLSGGCLVLCVKDDILSIHRFKEFIDKHKVEITILPPSYQREMANSFGSLKTIISAGEPLNETTGRYIQSQGIRLINGYGPTENTICATLSDDPIKQDGTVVIGKPVANVQVYILNKEKQLVPISVGGEIYIGGVQVARGYLYRPELTAERFIEDPFSKEPGARLYRSGDLGRWLPDGTIEYLGRIDDQVKIRGYRIELGEIESLLHLHQQVKQAVVLAPEDKVGNRQLVAYIVPTGIFNKQELIISLRDKLPDYMIPLIWVEVEKIPLTPNGKIDKKALSNIDILQSVGDDYIAPRNETEAKLALIWQDLLGINQIGIYNNFWELGGHSLLAMRIINAIYIKMEKEVSIMDLFVHPTIAGLAGFLENTGKDISQLLIPIKISGSKLPLYIVCGSGGTAFTFREFANLLDPDQPVYGLQQPTGNKGHKEFPDTIEDTAAVYINEIMASNPEGPYVLSGHCLGGVIAFEMARQLKAMNKKVAFLALFDTEVLEIKKDVSPAPGNFYNLPAVIKESISKMLLKIKFEIFLLIKHPKLALSYRTKKIRSLTGDNQDDTELTAFNEITKKLDLALNHYHLKPYEGNLLVFYAKEHYYFVDRMNGVTYKELKYNIETWTGWGKYAQSVEIFEVEGEHSTMFDPMHSVGLAKALQSHIDKETISL